MVISKRKISFHEVVVAGRKDPAVCSSNLEAPRRKTIRVFTTPQGAAISQLAKKDRQKKKNAKRKKTIMLLLSILLFQPEIRSETPNLNRTAYMGRTKRRSRQKLSVYTLFCMLALCFWKYLQTTFDFLLKNIICRNACIALNKVKCGQSLRGTCVPLFLYTVVTNGKTMIFHTGTLFADAIPCACSLFWLQSIFNNAGKSLKIKSRKTNLGQLPTFLVKPKRRNILLHFNFNQLHCHPHPTLYHKLASKFMEWRQVATYT